MDKFNQIKELLKTLTSDEVDELKKLLNQEETESDNNQEVVSEDLADNLSDKEHGSNEDTTSEDGEVTETGSKETEPDNPDLEGASSEDASENISTEVTEETPQEDTDATYDGNSTEDDTSDDGNQESSEENSDNDYDDIPEMKKVMPSEIGESDEDSKLTTESGEKIPVDFQSIIDAQNAKIIALESELSTYKSKVDGAFGFSQKVSMPTKVNRLYDDCSDVHIHK